MMTAYIGILDGKAKAWGVRIPDLPGCYGAGATAEAAIADAASAAREWIAHRHEAPKPRLFVEIDGIRASNEDAIVISLDL